jgi:hypothetical protein
MLNKHANGVLDMEMTGIVCQASGAMGVTMTHGY